MRSSDAAVYLALDRRLAASTQENGWALGVGVSTILCLASLEAPADDDWSGCRGSDRLLEYHTRRRSDGCGGRARLVGADRRRRLGGTALLDLMAQGLLPFARQGGVSVRNRKQLGQRVGIFSDGRLQCRLQM